MSLELKITEFFNSECPSDYSASVAEIGWNAGANTFGAALECEFNFVNDETRQDISANMRDYLDSFGDNSDSWDWDEYEEQSQQGIICGRLFKGIDNEIYIYLGE